MKPPHPLQKPPDFLALQDAPAHFVPLCALVLEISPFSKGPARDNDIQKPPCGWWLLLGFPCFSRQGWHLCACAYVYRHIYLYFYISTLKQFVQADIPNCNPTLRVYFSTLSMFVISFPKGKNLTPIIYNLFPYMLNPRIQRKGFQNF